jgi:hypothetical protein
MVGNLGGVGGQAGHLVKPVDYDALIELLDSLSVQR